MLQLKTFLESLDPKVWYLAVSGMIFLLTWLWRRFLPALWAAAVAKSPAIPQVWMMVLGALMSAAPAVGQGIGKIVQQTLLGAVFSALGANGYHAFLRDMPGPYDGAQRQVDQAEAARAATVPKDPK